MADLHEVVDFRAAADARFTDSGTVNRGVGGNFDVIFEHDDSGLDNFVIAAIVFLRISKPVGSDFRAVLKSDVMADNAKLAYAGVRICFEVVSDHDPAANMNEGVNDTVRSDLDVVFDDDIGTNRSAFSNRC